MQDKIFDYGMIGLGTMGRNLALNINDNGFSLAGFDKDTKQVALLKKDAGDRNMLATADLKEFVQSLKSPRLIILLVPAGKIVDDVINELTPLLDKDDLLMDCGNSHFTDTNKRIEQLKALNINFMGVGVSGGESGARHGPSIMPGGDKKVYSRVDKMLRSISAKADGEPCVTYMGNGSAGHYVKMVHNGIEYAIMQLIAEVYHILKMVGKMNNAELHTVFSKWNEGILHSFLIEITADIFEKKDDLTSHYLIDMVLDSAHQKGTGGWTSEDAMKLQVPIPTIDIAVSMRDLSAYKKEREAAENKLEAPMVTLTPDNTELLAQLEQTLYFAMITAYAQGMALLSIASTQYKYNLNLADISKIWRGGCIIRATLLEDIFAAYTKQPNLSNILLDDNFSRKLIYGQKAIRKVIKTGIDASIPMPGMMNSLAYYDSYRSGWLPANLIQAQRDYFGAHTYERTDREGIFHTVWNKKQE